MDRVAKVRVARRLELVCPAGNPPALRAAVDHGADWVYIGLRDETNVRNFPGLNFSEAHAAAGIRYAHGRRVKVLLAINTYPQTAGGERWKRAIDAAGDLGADAVILSDPGLMQYAAQTYPSLRLHLSVQASATNYEAINFYREHFGIARATLPRLLSLAQIQHIVRNTRVEMEVFGFGSLCVMLEGRCTLSSYVTGASPNTCGVCCPSSAVQWKQTREGLESRLSGVLVDRYTQAEKAAYPILCRGRYDVAGQTYHAFDEPSTLNTLELLSQLTRSGIAAVKIEGRQRDAAYVAQVTRIWREAIDRCYRDPDEFVVSTGSALALDKLTEGRPQTLGAQYRPWK